MTTLFENDDFRLLSTGHDYDFVGIIETKTESPLTFFFSEELCEHDESEEDDWDGYQWEDMVDESETKLLEVHEGLKEDDYKDETQEVIFSTGADSYFRARNDKSTGFLSNPRERGWFLAIIKAYCPEQLKNIPWA